MSVRCDYARCQLCGGQIHRWRHPGYAENGRWFHDTIDAEDSPFDIIDWWAHPEKQHHGIPAPLPPTGVCLDCGKEVGHRYDGKPLKYCGAACRQSAYRKRVKRTEEELRQEH